MSDSHIRKQVYDLNVEDFNEHPVWEFAHDEEGEEGQDEVTVRPFEQQGLLDPARSMFVIRAQLTLADRTRLWGYLTPPAQHGSDLGTIQPVAMAPQGQVSFWCGVVAPGANSVTAMYALMGKSSATEVFPVAFRSDIALVGGPVHGQVSGFLVIEDFNAKRTRVVT